MSFINNQSIDPQIRKIDDIFLGFFVIQFFQHFYQLLFLAFRIFDRRSVFTLCNQFFQFLNLFFEMLINQIRIVLDHIKG